MSWRYAILGSLYHLLPAAVRQLPVMRRLSERVTGLVAAHDDVYDEPYFVAWVEEAAVQAATVLPRLITSEFRPRRVIDVGCGTGALLEALTRLGCDCFGLEYADAALRMCRARGLDVRRFNLERDRLEPGVGRFDLAISMEVAEHLPERCADRFINLLTALSDTVIFTAATPGQGGTDHVNEQPHEYWIAKFQTRGFGYAKTVANGWRRELERHGVAAFYHKNLMIFRPARRGA